MKKLILLCVIGFYVLVSVKMWKAPVAEKKERGAPISVGSGSSGEDSFLQKAVGTAIDEFAENEKVNRDFAKLLLDGKKGEIKINEDFILQNEGNLLNPVICGEKVKIQVNSEIFDFHFQNEENVIGKMAAVANENSEFKARNLPAEFKTDGVANVKFLKEKNEPEMEFRVLRDSWSAFGRKISCGDVVKFEFAYYENDGKLGVKTQKEIKLGEENSGVPKAVKKALVSGSSKSELFVLASPKMAGRKGVGLQVIRVKIF